MRKGKVQRCKLASHRRGLLSCTGCITSSTYVTSSQFDDIGITTTTPPASDIAALCLSSWPAARQSDRLSYHHDIHAQHHLLLDSFIVSSQLIYFKLILRYPWHCIIGPTVFAITTCQLVSSDVSMVQAFYRVHTWELSLDPTQNCNIISCDCFYVKLHCKADTASWTLCHTTFVHSVSPTYRHLSTACRCHIHYIPIQFWACKNNNWQHADRQTIPCSLLCSQRLSVAASQLHQRCAVNSQILNAVNNSADKCNLTCMNRFKSGMLTEKDCIDIDECCCSV